MEPIITGDDSTFQLRKQKPFTMLKKACDVLANPENFNIDRSEQMTAPQAERNKQSAAAEKVAAEKVAAEKARERAEKFQAYKTTKPQDAEGIEKLQAQVENLVKRLYPDATVFVSAPSEPSSFPSITIKSALFSSLMGLSLSNLENVSGIATVNYNLPQNTVIFTIKNSRARAPALKVVQNGNR